MTRGMAERNGTGSISAHPDRHGGPARRLARGMTLPEALGRTGPMPQELALAIARRVALALAEKHARGKIHGALTPDRVLLLHDEPPGLRLLDGRSACAGPRCLSPEQARGEEPRMESDVYALGVVVFYMLTGQLPSQGRQGDVARRQLSGSPPTVAGLSPHRVSPALALLVQQCLSESPADRRLSAAGLAAMFAAVAERGGTGADREPAPWPRPEELWGRPRPCGLRAVPAQQGSRIATLCMPVRSTALQAETAPLMRAVRAAAAAPRPHPVEAPGRVDRALHSSVAHAWVDARPWAARPNHGV